MKRGNEILKVLRYICLSCVIAIGFMTIIGTSGGGDGDGDGDGDSCAGPVPCLTLDSGNTSYEFLTQFGISIFVSSDGAIVGGGTMWDIGLPDPVFIGLAGPVTDCRNAVLDSGFADLDDNGNIDPGEKFGSVSGNVNICNVTLTVSNLVFDGFPQQDIVATYVGTITSSLSGTLQIDIEPRIKFLQKVMERRSIE